MEATEENVKSYIKFTGKVSRQRIDGSFKVNDKPEVMTPILEKLVEQGNIEPCNDCCVKPGADPLPGFKWLKD